MSAANLLHQLATARAALEALARHGMGDAVVLLDVRDDGITIQLDSDAHIPTAQDLLRPTDVSMKPWRKTLRGSLTSTVYGYILLESRETIWRRLNA
jgi:hypothetical protein